MLEHKKIHPIVALFSAAALMVSAPALAQAPAAKGAPAAAASNAAASNAASNVAPANAAAANAAPATDAAADNSAASGDASAAGAGADQGKLTLIKMFMQATIVVKCVMLGLLASSLISWTILIVKLMEFGSLNRTSDRFLESFRSAKSIGDMRRIATSDEFEGNPLADMAAAASEEVELSRQAGLQVSGANKDTTMNRAASAVSAVQASLAKRLAGGQQFLATIGSSGPFIGLFGTVFGIMNSFIGIANTNTTNLSVVAPGIAEALLATGIGLFAAIPSVIFYNYFQTRIAAYGARSEGFVAEVLNAISRQLDKGA
ncbi:MAG TPA: MotA/TolQ/ExbB proton channel family protein [Caulobacteraceae bacterium]|jgi:biopolymer transport protein ExbB|nr:MotA/TolQ/ExbB proton channel family protein [Caulobacteraceae bacterium]